VGVKIHLRKGDEIVVLSGKDKGRRGKVQRINKNKGLVLVEGINLVKKHARPTKTNPQGGVIDQAMPLPVAKVMLVCPGCEEPIRIKREKAADGSLVRVCRKCGRALD